MQVIYGSAVSPFTGPQETKNGRLTIHQALFTELGHVPEGYPVDCQLFGPTEIISEIKEKLHLDYDKDSITPCLLFHGHTADLMDLLRNIFPDIEELNSDDDDTFEMLTAN